MKQTIDIDVPDGHELTGEQFFVRETDVKYPHIHIRLKQKELELIEVRDYLMRTPAGIVVKGSAHKNLGNCGDIQISTGFIR